LDYGGWARGILENKGCEYSEQFEDLKLYLRPMASMTNVEWEIYENMCDSCRGEEYHKLIDFLNSRHIDYRGLIERGLALEAPKGMYKFSRQ
jgi:hypothetical protein